MENKNYMNMEMNEMDLEEISGGWIRPLCPHSPINPVKPAPKKKWKTVWDIIRESLLL